MNIHHHSLWPPPTCDEVHCHVRPEESGAGRSFATCAASTVAAEDSPGDCCSAVINRLRGE